MENSTEWDALESPTARCTNSRSMPTVQSRNQRAVAARVGSVGAVVAARGRNRTATVGAPVSYEYLLG